MNLPTMSLPAMQKATCWVILFLLTGTSLWAQLGVNTDNSAPDASAGLDVKFTNKGLLPPRVALTAINSALPVTTPAVGLLVYNTATAGTPPNNVVPGYHCWNGIKWIPVVAPQGANVGDMQYWNGTQWVSIPVGSNGQVLTLNNGVPAWTNQCGISVTINHIAGAVAPVSKSVTYGTTTNIPGEPSKCWITSNLGADHQAVSVDDATEASAGWYWQFNRQQGYKYEGTAPTPNTTWINSINENSDWVAVNDPCTIEFGGSWRIPTLAELTNVDASGNWADWNGPWNSGLKLHAAGSIYYGNASIGNRGSTGDYWSSKQSSVTNCWGLDLYSGYCGIGSYSKAYGFSIRCLRDL